MKKIYTLIISSSLIIAINLTLHAQMGCLDNTFGFEGIVTTNIGDNDQGKSIALQTDDKIVVAGSSQHGSTSDFALVRYNSNGTLDSTFGSGGIVTTDTGTGSSVLIQPDGKIVVGGTSYHVGNNYDFGLIRYNSNGTLDSTFGSGGRVSTNFVNNDNIWALVLQTDGKIVAAGFRDSASYSAFALARYKSNGTLDSTFGSNGKVITDFSIADNDGGRAIALQPNGKIVVAGGSWIGSNLDIALVRYNSNGSLDTTFGSGGKVTTDFGSSQETANSVILQPDGKIVVAGSYSGSSDAFALVRYNSNGRLDTTFGSGGKVTTDVGYGHLEDGRSVVLQPDGKIVVAGWSSNGSGSSHDFALVRYNSNGSLDSTVCVGGIVVTNFGPGRYDEGYSVALQSDGKILVAGLTSDGTNDSFAVVRYNMLPTGINTISKDDEVSLYPNPATSQLTINLGSLQAEQVSIYNVDGKLVSEVKQPANNRIDISGLAVGVYVAEVKVSDAVQRMRWVKM